MQIACVCLLHLYMIQFLVIKPQKEENTIYAVVNQIYCLLLEHFVMISSLREH